MYNSSLIDQLPDDSKVAAEVVCDSFFKYFTVKAKKEELYDAFSDEYILHHMCKTIYDFLYENTESIQHITDIILNIIRERKDIEVERKRKLVKLLSEIKDEFDFEIRSSFIRIDNKNLDECKVVCRHCGSIGKLDASQYKEDHRPIKVRCRCGVKFRVVLDRRKYYRKEVRLPGIYNREMTDIGGNAVTVENLSRGGAGFRTRYDHDIHVGERLQLRFVLDNNVLREIRKEVLVRHVNGRYIGVQFDRPDAQDQQIAAYLMGDMD
jgi:hypothetical protein